MRRYTATWGLNLVPDPAEEAHESIYESAPTEIEGEDFSAAAKRMPKNLCRRTTGHAYQNDTAQNSFHLKSP